MSKKQKAAKFEAEQGAMFVMEKDGSFSLHKRMDPKFDDTKWTKEILARPASAREAQIGGGK